MRIKRLEIQGFKSFKDKTVIYFDRPITGIVGPNGSGKSNIVDAFFWVMGEQSYKHIRSSGSDDIIFKGSSKYQPLGMAEATLVLEQDVVDTENAPMGASSTEEGAVSVKKREISVTRRVYRSGEGEYFINGVQARLKDIHELFLDTGAGAKGYSVIEQGQIDKVVNSKPEDRRLIIEDAAGIAKYKARKKESLKKLEGANQNLARINDVLAEIDRSLSSLERQAQKARRYKEYRAELLEKETAWGRRKFQVLNRQFGKIEQDRAGLDHLLVGLRAELSQCELDLETRRVEQLNDSKLVEQLQAGVESYSSDLTHHQSALELSRKRQEDLNRQLVQLASEKEQIEEELNQYRESVAAKSEEFSGLDGKVEALTAQAEELSSKVFSLRDAHDTNKREAETNRRQFVELTEKTSQSYSKIATFEERIQGAEARLQALKTQEQEILAELQIQRQELVAITEKLEERTHARDEARGALEQKKLELAETETTTKTLRSDRDRALKELTSLSSRLKSLEELEKAREGMANGPKKILEWSSEKGSPFAVLSDFIEVESGYEAAVEAVLGHAFERLYAQDASAAFSALQFLRENDAGSAAIQIAIPSAEFKEKASYNPLHKFVRLVSPEGYSVENSRAVHRLIEVLVSSVEVLEEVPAVSDIRTYQAEGISFVTRNGIWFDSNQGVLFGGNAESDQAGSLLARKRIIQELKGEVAAAEVRQLDLENALSAAGIKLEGLQTEVQSLSQSRSDLEVEVNSLDRGKSQIERKVSEVERSTARFSGDREQIEEQISASRASIEELQTSLAEMAERKSEIEVWIKDHEERLSMKDEELRASETSLQDVRIQEASERERKNSLKKELETEQRFLQDRERRLSEVDRLLETFGQDRSQYSDGDQEHESEIQRLSRLLSEKREELSILKDRFEQSNSLVTSGMERIKELHKLGDEKTQALTQLSIDIERVVSELGHLKANMEEKYGVGCLEEAQGVDIQEEMNDPVVTIEMSEEEEKVLHADVEELREKIRRLGEVNTMAVEEYEAMQKRHEHLFKEKADLETSMQNLNEAIEHINKTSEERFQKAFEAIASRFEKLFPIIFGGGQAQLSLVYPEGSTDILDAGVDILAQPPGKKISNMTLLSGGEKALTALSLIFAIFMVKPSPFCILDEVDAPLDDSNIGKFNALVREMSVKSQFILVTHNKKTMELNDALYGVTMEEPGVSRMVSIQLQ
ncbi:MAG: chromosome segregation protein SMC [Bdellovibrionales bacterium]|nr:chromosome segregation protein SMC [Bdellovibrionales bacterium]